MALGFFRGLFRGMRADTGQDHGGGKLVSGGPPPTVTYFGLCDSSGNTTGSGTANTGGTETDWNNAIVQPFTCPGTGTQNVKSLQCSCHIGTGGAYNIRIGIFTSNGTGRQAQGTAEVAVTGATDTWQGHTWSSSYPTLTGGTNYVLAVSADGDLTTDHGLSVDSGYSKYDATDYTGGFNTDLPTGTSGTFIFPIRCGVEPA